MSNLGSDWSEAPRLAGLDKSDVWENAPSGGGVYGIVRKNPVSRIGGEDPLGVLYIGRTKNLRYRLWQFWKATHTASGFLWTHPTIARIVLGRSVRSVMDVEKHLGNLSALYSTPLDGDDLARAERAALFAYIQKYGEAPPLNLSLPSRWSQQPPANDLRWAEEGILGGS